jgi:hypothetical protein
MGFVYFGEKEKEPVFKMNDENLAQVVHILAVDFLSRLPDQPLPIEYYPSTYEVAVNILSQWIDSFISEYSFEELTEKHFDQFSLWAANCTALVPRCADHFYRLGIIECYRCQRASALDAFRKAAEATEATELDRPGLHSREKEIVDATVRCTFASLALDGLRMARDKELAWARFAATAAKDLNAGSFKVFKNYYRAVNPPPSKEQGDPSYVKALEDCQKGSEIERLDHFQKTKQLDKKSLWKQYDSLGLVREMVENARIQHVRKKAFQLWASAGRPAGQDDDFWDQAEKQIWQELGFPPAGPSGIPPSSPGTAAGPGSSAAPTGITP